MFFFVNLFCFEIEKRLENCFYKEDRLISFRNCIEIFQWFLVGVRIRKVFLYIEEYIGIIVVKIKRCNRNLY